MASRASRQMMRKRLFQAAFLGVLLMIPAIALAPANLDLMDLPEFYSAARMVVAGHPRDIYSIAEITKQEQAYFPFLLNEGGRFVPFFVTPPAVPLLLPIAAIPLGAIKVVWMCVLTFATGCSLVLLAETFGLSDRWLLGLAAYTAIYGPQWEAVRHGQLAPLSLLAVSAALLVSVKQRERLSGFFLSLLIAKPQFFLPLGTYLCGARKFKMVVVAVAVVLALTIVSFFVLGFDAYAAYTALMHSEMQGLRMQPDVGPTLRGQLLRLFPGAFAPVLNVSTFVLIATICFTAHVGHRMKRSPFLWHVAAILLVPLGIVSAVYAQNYELVLLLPGVCALAANGRELLGKHWVLLLTACLLCLTLPFYAALHYTYLLHGGVVNPSFVSLCGFVALGFYAWRRAASMDETQASPPADSASDLSETQLGA